MFHRVRKLVSLVAAGAGVFRVGSIWVVHYGTCVNQHQVRRVLLDSAVDALKAGISKDDLRVAAARMVVVIHPGDVVSDDVTYLARVVRYEHSRVTVLHAAAKDGVPAALKHQIARTWALLCHAEDAA